MTEENKDLLPTEPAPEAKAPASKGKSKTKLVMYKGALQTVDATGKKIEIVSDGKEPIELPAADADKLIRRGRAYEPDPDVIAPKTVKTKA